MKPVMVDFFLSGSRAILELDSHPSLNLRPRSQRNLRRFLALTMRNRKTLTTTAKVRAFVFVMFKLKKVFLNRRVNVFICLVQSLLIAVSFNLGTVVKKSLL